MEKTNNKENINIPKEIPCVLCGDFQEIKLTKNNKPYFICNACGIQTFIRKADGISRLQNLIQDRTLYKKIYLPGKFLENSYLFRLKERINLIKDSLNKLGFNLLKITEEYELEKALRSKLKQLELQYINNLKKIDDEN